MPVVVPTALFLGKRARSPRALDLYAGSRPTSGYRTSKPDAVLLLVLVPSSASDRDGAPTRTRDPVSPPRGLAEGQLLFYYFFTQECVRPHAAYAAVVVVHVLILLSTLVSTLPQSPPARSAGENLRLVRARAPSTVGDGGSRAAQG